MTIKSLISRTLSFREECLGFSQKYVGKYFLQSVFSMKIFLSRVYPKTIMIIGRWSRINFLRYIRIQFSDLVKGISDLMVTTHDLYTIPKEENIYFTPGQSGTQSHRLHQQQWNVRNTTSSLSLPL